jgi:23S rRNA (adenine2030-N6)-methyltransferase
MNYRHAFHAGNFADVLKHAVLVRILVHLRAKPAAFRVIDTHAGAGLYDLAGPEAARSGEWREGIDRLLGALSGPGAFSGKGLPRTRSGVEAGFPPKSAPADLGAIDLGAIQGRSRVNPRSVKMRPTQESGPRIGEGARALLAPYVDAVAAFNDGGRLTTYPGSPALVRAFLRAQDRLTACELEPNAAAALARNLHGDRRSKAIAIDGWTALNAYVPPKERRGLVLVDPPFEEADDFQQLAQGLEAAHRKWASGSYLLWYPIKERAAPTALARRLLRGGMGAASKILRVELGVGEWREANRLGACGLLVVNPPWTLESELAVLLPALAAALSGDGLGSHRVDWLRGEK